MIIKAITGLAAAGMLQLLTGPVHAVESEALELLQQGYSECKSAQLYRRKDFDKAKEIYGNYLMLKRKALNKDQTLANGLDPGVSRILEYCDRVGSDIARVEATPILMQGLEACKIAETYKRAGSLSKTQEAFQAYINHRKQAVKVSASVLTIPSLASDLQRCDRVQRYIETESNHIADTNNRIRVSLTHLETALALCKSAGSSKRTAPDWFERQHEEVLGMDSSIPNQDLIKKLPSGSKNAKAIAGLRKSVASCEKSLAATIDRKRRSKVAAEQQRQQKNQLAAEAARQKKQADHNAQLQKELKAEQAKIKKRLAAEEARKRRELEAETEKRRQQLAAEEQRQRQEREAKEEARRKAWAEEDQRRRERLAREEAERREAWAAEDQRRRQALAAEEEQKRKALAEDAQRAKASADEEERNRQAVEKKRDRRLAERQQGDESAMDSEARLIANAAYYKLVRQVRPAIPRDTLPPGTSGYVIIEYFINTKGRVVHPVVVASQPTPALGRLTLAAVRKWRYKSNFGGRKKEEAFIRAQLNFASKN